MSEGARTNETADPFVSIPSKDDRAWLAGVLADAADGSLWGTPSIREQLRDHYKKAGLSE